MAALAAAEAAAQPGDVGAALDGDLAALDGGLENPDDRRNRVGEFVETHFTDIVPAAYVTPAVDVCCQYEDQLRDLFAEPNLVVAQEDAEDPTLRQRVENAVTVAANDDTIAGLSDDRDELQATAERNETEVIPATEAELATVRATEVRERAGLAADEAENAVVAEDLGTVRELQANFDRLKAEHGTIGALQMLLEGENALQNPEMRAIVQRTIGTAHSLVTALPGREDVVTRLLDGANLNLGAATNAAAFADFLSAVDASEELSDEEKEALRQVLNAGDEVQTGGDANDTFEYGAIETYVDENGEVQERRVPLQPGQRVPFGDGHELGLDENGQRKAWIRTEIGTYETDLPDNATDQDMGRIIRTVQLRAKLHELNAASIFFNDVDALEYGGGQVEVHPDHFDTTDRFLDVVVRNQALAGNQLLGAEDLSQIDYLMQFHDRRGDLGGADVDPERVLGDYEAQGIVEENGTLNWDRFAELVDANRANRYAESDFEHNREAA